MTLLRPSMRNEVFVVVRIMIERSYMLSGEVKHPRTSLTIKAGLRSPIELDFWLELIDTILYNDVKVSLPYILSWIEHFLPKLIRRTAVTGYHFTMSCWKLGRTPIRSPPYRFPSNHPRPSTAHQPQPSRVWQTHRASLLSQISS